MADINFSEQVQPNELPLYPGKDKINKESLAIYRKTENSLDKIIAMPTDRPLTDTEIETYYKDFYYRNRYERKQLWDKKYDEFKSGKITQEELKKTYANLDMLTRSDNDAAYNFAFGQKKSFVYNDENGLVLINGKPIQDPFNLEFNRKESYERGQLHDLAKEYVSPEVKAKAEANEKISSEMRSETYKTVNHKQIKDKIARGETLTEKEKFLKESYERKEILSKKDELRSEHKETIEKEFDSSNSNNKSSEHIDNVVPETSKAHKGYYQVDPDGNATYIDSQAESFRNLKKEPSITDKLSNGEYTISDDKAKEIAEEYKEEIAEIYRKTENISNDSSIENYNEVDNISSNSIESYNEVENVSNVSKSTADEAIEELSKKELNGAGEDAIKNGAESMTKAGTSGGILSGNGGSKWLKMGLAAAGVVAAGALIKNKDKKEKEAPRQNLNTKMAMHPMYSPSNYTNNDQQLAQGISRYRYGRTG